MQEKLFCSSFVAANWNLQLRVWLVSNAPIACLRNESISDCFVLHYLQIKLMTTSIKGFIVLTKQMKTANVLNSMFVYCETLISGDCHEDLHIVHTVYMINFSKWRLLQSHFNTHSFRMFHIEITSYLIVRYCNTLNWIMEWHNFSDGKNHAFIQ